MKKCKWLLALVLSVAMMFTACGGATLEGEWQGKWYVGDIFAEGMGSEYAAYSSYFDDIYILLNLEISEDEIEISIDKESEELLRDGLETAMTDFMKEYVKDIAEESGMSAEDFYSYLGMDEDEFIDYMLESMDLDYMVESVFEDIDTATVEYEVNDDVLEVEYEDGDDAEWKFDLKGNVLVLEMDVDGMDVEIEFERQ